MPTIDELMAGKQPGEIKVRYFDWPKERWFRPYFKTGQWHGVTQGGVHDSWDSNSSMWQLWQEPEEEVEVFEWMYRLPNQQNWGIHALLMTEREAQEELIKKYQYRKTGRSWRLPR